MVQSYSLGGATPPGEYDWICCFLRPTRVHNPNSISVTSGCFCTVHVRVSSGKWGHAVPLQSYPFTWGSVPPSNMWFIGPTQVFNPNGISIVSAVLAWLTSVTDRPTNHATWSVTVGRIYIVILRCGLISTTAKTTSYSVTEVGTLSGWPWSAPPAAAAGLCPTDGWRASMSSLLQ